MINSPFNGHCCWRSDKDNDGSKGNDIHYNVILITMTHGRHGVLNYCQLECLSNSLFRLTMQ